jgi:peptide deformylase
MALLEILTYPNPRLEQTSVSVEEVNDDIRQLVSDMTETMYEADGVGLAAPQVGVLQRIIVLDCSARFDDQGNETGEREPTAIINPVITQKEGEIVWEEGCLSVPDYTEEVQRAAEVTVQGLNPEGEAIEIEADGLFSVCLQHEIDHLDGILFVDRLSRLKSNMIKKRLKKRARDEE